MVGVVAVARVPGVTVPLVSTMLCVVDMMRVLDVLGMDRMDGRSAVLVVVGHGSPPIVTPLSLYP
jgi:hypothetical protein